MHPPTATLRSRPLPSNQHHDTRTYAQQKREKREERKEKREKRREKREERKEKREKRREKREERAQHNKDQVRELDNRLKGPRGSTTLGFHTRTFECTHTPLLHERASSISMKLVIIVIIVILLLYSKALPSSCGSSLVSKVIHYAHYSFIIGNDCEIGCKHAALNHFYTMYTLLSGIHYYQVYTIIRYTLLSGIYSSIEYR